jgi:uncharacterized protein (DUF1800 family)
MTIPWTAENAAHLLRRAGFSPRPDEVAEAVAAGMKATVKSLFQDHDPPEKYPGSKKKPATIFELQAWWIRRLAKSKSPLLEKLTLFWHNHFATGYSKVVDPRAMFEQNVTLRSHAAGNFYDLVLAIARDPAMLIWLDGNSNVKGSPNLNFARELMELFTTGVYAANGQPTYTEADVKEGARAFTGWTVMHGQFAFRPDLHDYGFKTFKGVTGMLGGEHVVQIVCADGRTARRLAWKLFNFFVRQVDLADPVLEPLVGAYKESGGNIKTIVKTLLQLDAFYAPEAKRAHVKSPAEFVAGAFRQLRCKLGTKKKDAFPFATLMHQLGQSIFDPPTVFGWDEGKAWVTSNTLMARMRLGNQIALARPGGPFPYPWDVAKLLPPIEWPALTAEAVVDRVAAALGLESLTGGARAALVSYLESDDLGNPQAFVLDEGVADQKVRGLVALLLGSPEYQCS